MNLTDLSEKRRTRFNPIIASRLLDELSRKENVSATGVFDETNYDLRHSSTQGSFNNWTYYFCREGNNTLIIESIEDRPSENSYEEEIEDFLTLLISKGIRVPEPESISNYALKYRDMLDVMIHICVLAKERVNLDTQLSLELYKDIEVADEYPTLYVRNDSYGDDILNIIEDVSAESDKEIDGKSGWFLATTDFDKPRL